ncbi:MAG TPA: UDP-N-acetylmuramoyl-tripeptide--D-alanyl-D-alanine ligase [Candidatus Kapabacteria bacterium]|nr:UDP-N-acetylmuramoyl-tripeptide--D-alanyl-D-alanine ligase [Candidatus Kapabacteria bacterium]
MNISVQDLLDVPFSHEIGVRDLGPARTFREVSTDSRTLKPGDLFIALHGPNFDGHKYLGEITKEGATAAIVSERWFAAHKNWHHTLPILVVKDPLHAFGTLAGIYRTKFKIPVLVIAGSNGKTTTKELIAHTLSGELDVLKSEANFNNQIGVPHTLLHLRDGHQAAIIEIGTNHSGEIARLCAIAQPTLALLTNIGREHLEFFKDVKGVAKEEMAAFDYVFEHGGHAFINMDDPFLAPAAQTFGDRAITYGSGVSSDGRAVHAYKSGFAKDGRLELRVGCEGKSFRIRSHLIADYTPNLVAAAVAVGIQFHLRRPEIKSQIDSFRPHNKRLEIVRLEGITVLNDAYNANPDSMESALRTLAEYPVAGRRFAVLGDMFELGKTSQREHRALGRKIAEYPLHRVLFTGKDMQLASKSYHTAAGKTNGAAKNSYFKTKVQLAASLRKLLQPGDAVLIKGSRGMKMEEVIDLIQKG